MPIGTMIINSYFKGVFVICITLKSKTGICVYQTYFNYNNVFNRAKFHYITDISS